MFFAFFIQKIAAQDVEITLIITQPPVQLEAFLDPDDLGYQILTVKNLTNQTLELYATGNLDSDNGIHAETTPASKPAQPLVLAPNEMRTLTGQDAFDHLSEFTEDDFLVNATEEQRNQLLIDRIVPEGLYSYCLTVRDFLTDLPVPQTGLTCGNFSINHSDRPIILTPNEGFAHNLDENGGQILPLNISWTVNGFVPADLRFDLKIVDLGNDPANVPNHNDALDDPGQPAFFEENDFAGQVFWYDQTIGLPPFEIGHRYALRVSAKSQMVYFNYNGHSEARVFEAKVANPAPGDGEDCPADFDDLAFFFNPAYPAENDTLPFDFVPCIARMAPYCDNLYKSFEYGVGVDIPEKLKMYVRNAHTVNWPQGQLHFLRNDMGIKQADEFRAAHFILNLRPAQMAAFGPGNFRGDAFTWQGSGTVFKATPPDNQGRQNFIQTQHFVQGMPRPVLKSPADKKIVPKNEEIALGFRSGNAPQKLMPAFLDIITAQGNQEIGHAELGKIEEACVLQVSKTPGFSAADLLFSKKTDTDFQFAPPFPANLPDKLYRNIEAKFTPKTDGKYYWRVVWLRDPKKVVPDAAFLADNDFYHASPTWMFEVKSDQPPVEDKCKTACAKPKISDRAPVNALAVGQKVQFGNFEMTVKSTSPSSPFAGTGAIEVPFFNKNRFVVNFKNLKVNAAGQVVEGEADAAYNPDEKFVPFLGVAGGFAGLTSNQISALAGMMEAQKRISDYLLGGKELDLPVGLDHQIGGQRVIAGLTALHFEPEKATAAAAALGSFRIETALVALGFAAKFEICPDGPSGDTRLFLPQNVGVQFSSGSAAEFLGEFSGNGKKDELTYVDWECLFGNKSAFKEANLVFEITWPRATLLPENDKGEIQNGNVKSHFRGSWDRDGDFFGRGTMTAFQFSDLPGWGFLANEVVFDQSDKENPLNFKKSLPPGYDHPAFASNDPKLENTWKGFFLRDLEMRGDPEFNGPQGKRPKAGVHNLIHDDAWSFSVKATDFLKYDDGGDIGGWAVSLDTVRLDLVRDVVSKAELNGKIGLPVTKPGEFFRYSAFYQPKSGQPPPGGGQGKKEHHLIFNIKPDEADIHIPMLIAEGKVAKTSWVRAETVIGKGTVLDFNLSASLDLNDQWLPQNLRDKLPASISMPKMEVENLRYNSEDGFIEEDKTRFSLASPQKNVSGFPISIDKPEFKGGLEPSVGFGIRLELAGDKNSFSGKTKLVLKAKPIVLLQRKYTDLVDISLECIELKAKTSKIGLAGKICFYDENQSKGIRGQVDFDLEVSEKSKIGGACKADFGIFKTPGATDFNTKDWFAYFSVDGMVVFSPTLKLFTGLDLYGLGGGISHRMRQKSALPVAANVLNSGPNKGSGVAYEPDWNTMLGLQFMAVCGSPKEADDGKAYNFDATLRAEFSNNWGLTLLQLKGNARVLTKGVSAANIANPMEVPVGGYVEVTFSDPPEGEAFLDGKLLVRASFPDKKNRLIYGSTSSVPDAPPPFNSCDDAVVWATFRVSESKTYFRCGEMAHDRRAGLILNINPILKVDAKTYLMLGDDIPSEIPPPSAEFLAIFDKGRQESTSLEGGDPRSELFGKPRPPLEGSGFAHGSSFAVKVNVKVMPFYFNMEGAFGYDLNFVRPNNVPICSNTGSPLGADGWYAQGQVYAGVLIDAGLFVNLWFYEGSVSILSASAAFILQGGLPNPEWIEGRGSISYSVLKGLIKGNYRFKFKAGEQCKPEGDGPLAGIEIITDLQPSGNKISVFADPEVAFSVPMNEVFEVLDENGDIRKIEPYLFDFKLLKNGGPEPGEIQLSANRESAKLKKTNMMAQNTAHSLRAEVRAREKGQDLYHKGKIWAEVDDANFTTGAKPDRIPADQVALSYPYFSQTCFLKKETAQNLGFVQFSQGMYPYFETTDPAYPDSFFIRMLTGDSAKPLEVPIARVDGGFQTVYFDVSKLENDRIYSLQIVHWKNPAAGGGRSFLKNNALFTSTSYSKLLNAPKSGSTAEARKRTLAHPGNTVGPQELLLFQYFFKTSKYDLFSEKIAAADPAWTGYLDYPNLLNGDGTERYTVCQSLPEPLEWCDEKRFKISKSANAKEQEPAVYFHYQLQSSGGGGQMMMSNGQADDRNIYFTGAGPQEQSVNQGRISWHAAVADANQFRGANVKNPWMPGHEPYFASKAKGTVFKGKLSFSAINQAFNFYDPDDVGLFTMLSQTAINFGGCAFCNEQGSGNLRLLYDPVRIGRINLSQHLKGAINYYLGNSYSLFPPRTIRQRLQQVAPGELGRIYDILATPESSMGMIHGRHTVRCQYQFPGIGGNLKQGSGRTVFFNN